MQLTLQFSTSNCFQSLPLLTIVLNNSVDDQKLQRSAQVTQILFNTLVDGSLPADVESRSSIIELLFALHPASFDDQILLSSMFDTYCMNKVRCVFQFVLEKRSILPKSHSKSLMVQSGYFLFLNFYSH